MVNKKDQRSVSVGVWIPTVTPICPRSAVARCREDCSRVHPTTTGLLQLCIVWHSDSVLCRLQAVQNAAAHLVTGSGRRELKHMSRVSALNVTSLAIQIGLRERV